MKFIPRKWQSDADQAEAKLYAAHIASGQKKPFCQALMSYCGTGKTKAKAMIANRHMDSGHVEASIFVTTREPIKKSWAIDFGYNFDKHIQWDWNADLPILRDNYIGIALTYHQLCVPKVAEAIHEFCKRVRTHVNLDEIHHLWLQGGWGKAAAHAFQFADSILPSSGTLWRTQKDQRMSFVPMNDKNEYDPFYRYGFYEAVLDDVIASPLFYNFDGELSWECYDESFRRRLGGLVDVDEERSGALRTYFNLDNDAFKKQIDTFMEKVLLERKRITGWSPLGLVVGQGYTQDAEVREITKLHEYIKKRFGSSHFHTAVCTHDTPNAHKLIEKCMRDDSDIGLLSSIRMVTEGVDMRRTVAILLATGWLTELEYNQLVMRGNRLMPGKSRFHVLQANDIRLKFYAGQLIMQKARALEELQARKKKKNGGGGNNEEEDIPVVSTYKFVSGEDGERVSIQCPFQGEIEGIYCDEAKAWAKEEGVAEELIQEDKLGRLFKRAYERVRKDEAKASAHTASTAKPKFTPEEPEEPASQPYKTRQDQEKKFTALLHEFVKRLKPEWFGPDLKPERENYASDEEFEKAKREAKETNERAYKESHAKLRRMANLPGSKRPDVEGLAKMIGVVKKLHPEWPEWYKGN